MTPSEIFSISNSVIFIGWVLLIILPKWRYTQSIILNGLLVVFGILYSFLLFKDIGELSADSFGTLAKLKLLFQRDTAVLAGWVHYLIFDLFVGSYIVRKSVEIGLPRIAYTCILPFALMCGPIGYLIFVIAKTFKVKTLIEVN